MLGDLGVSFARQDVKTKDPSGLGESYYRGKSWNELLAAAPLFHTMYQSNGFGKSTPPQNRQLFVVICSSKQ